MKRDLYSILIEKTSGEALKKVEASTNSGEDKDGIEAFRVLYQWYTDTSDLAVSELRKAAMTPNGPKHDEDVVEYIEKWQESLRDLKRLEKEDSSLPAVYKI